MIEVKESLLHKQGKRIIKENEQLWIPKYIEKVDKNRIELLVIREGILSIKNGIEEAHLPYNYNPDIQVDTNEFGKLNIEITVTHGIDMEKELKIEKSGIPTLEIVLTGAEKYEYNYLTSYVLTKAKKRWVIPTSYIENLYNLKKKKFLLQIQNILKSIRVVGIKGGKLSIWHRNKVEDIEIEDSGLYKYEYDSVLDEDYNTARVITKDGEEILGISILDGDIKEIVGKVREGIRLHIIDLRELYKKYMLGSYEIIDYKGEIRVEKLEEYIEKNFKRYNLGIDSKELIRRVVENRLYRKNIRKLGDKYCVSNCPRGYKDYNYESENEDYKTCADVEKRCRNCEECYKYSYNWEEDIYDIRCGGKEEIKELVKKEIEYKGEMCYNFLKNKEKA